MENRGIKWCLRTPSKRDTLVHGTRSSALFGRDPWDSLRDIGRSLISGRCP